jgi:hypothetical protein
LRKRIFYIACFIQFVFLSNAFSQIKYLHRVDSSMLNNRIQLVFQPGFSFASYSSFATPLDRNLRAFAWFINLKAGYFVLKNLVVGIEGTFGRYSDNVSIGNRYPDDFKSKGIFAQYFPSNWRVYNFNKYTSKKGVKVFAHPVVSAQVYTTNYYIARNTINNYTDNYFNNRNDNLGFQFLLGVQVNVVKKINFQFLKGYYFQQPVKNQAPNTKLTKLRPSGQITLLFYINKKKK